MVSAMVQYQNSALDFSLQNSGESVLMEFLGRLLEHRDGINRHDQYRGHRASALEPFSNHT